MRTLALLATGIVIVTELGCGPRAATHGPTDQWCPVHNCLLRQDSVPIVYGLLEFDEDYLAAREKQFPNANTYAVGGCIELPDTVEVVWHCPQCRKVAQTWRSPHGEHTPEGDRR